MRKPNSIPFLQRIGPGGIREACAGAHGGQVSLSESAGIKPAGRPVRPVVRASVCRQARDFDRLWDEGGLQGHPCASCATADALRARLAQIQTL